MLFTITTPAYSQIYKSQGAYHDKENSGGSIYGNNYSTSSGDSESGLFRAADSSNPLDRPGENGGGGIGEENSPLGDGLFAWLAGCAVMFVIVKVALARKAMRKKESL